MRAQAITKGESRGIAFVRWMRGYILVVLEACAALALGLTWISGFQLAATIIGVAALVLAVVLRVLAKPTYGKLFEEYVSQQRTADQTRGALRKVLRAQLQRLAQEAGIDQADSRLSIYFHHEDCFILLGRYSANPTLEAAGRTEYPSDEGVISRVWANGCSSVTDLPDDLEEWVAAQIEEHGMSDQTARAITMKARSLGGHRIDTTAGPIGIVIRESMEPEAIKFKALQHWTTRQQWEVLAQTLRVAHLPFVEALELGAPR